ncbi:MAG: RimK family alpha-L-glutamate ligase [Eubacteriales bacterium]|nr:RimK family alpha-L-glutamate ligase [Eubacteriales bacterium]
MPQGLLVVNAFLKTNKFDEIYLTLLEAAKSIGIGLEVKTNAEVVCELCAASFPSSSYDFVLFWDKDVQLAMALEGVGMRLFNSADSILACDDKALTWLRLKDKGVPMPMTVIAPKTFPNIGYPSLDFVDEVARTLGFPIVLKECFGSFGQQVYLLEELGALRAKVQALAGTPMLFQRAVKESLGHDARINVVGGKVVASMLRRSTDGDFRSNLSRGGAMEAYTPTPQEEAIALKATKELGLDFAGVDVLFGKDGPILCEVNSNAHFKTTLQCTGVNMAAEIMGYIAESIR